MSMQLPITCYPDSFLSEVGKAQKQEAIRKRAEKKPMNLWYPKWLKYLGNRESVPYRPGILSVPTVEELRKHKQQFEKEEEMRKGQMRPMNVMAQACAPSINAIVASVEVIKDFQWLNGETIELQLLALEGGVKMLRSALDAEKERQKSITRIT